MYKSCTELEGFGLRRSNWAQLEENNSYFTNCIKKRFKEFYNLNILKPLMKKKLEDCEYLKSKHNINEVLIFDQDVYDRELMKPKPKNK